jgi:DNA polymerase-3 subunit gamma/tau
VAQPGVNPYPQWPAVVERIRDADPMLYSYLKKSKAYFDGTRVLIDGGRVFRDFIRANKLSQQRIKKVIAEVSGISVPIGPYEPKAAKADAPAQDAEQSLHALEALGLEVHISDTEKPARRK